jgi:hypothetical protein
LHLLAFSCYSSGVQNAIAAAVKVSKKATAEAEKDFALASSAKDLKPWYSERTKNRPEKTEDEKR